MITKIIIQNFQSHEKTVLNLVKGTNIIVGKSDCGKSAILRALKWLIYNRPGGTAFQSSWGGVTSVEVHLSGGEVIKRVRGKVDNYYMLNESRFDALGGKVPDEIKKVMNLELINFQEQFDQPFLLSATSGEVANHFNNIAGISQIEISTKLLKKEITSTKQNLISAHTQKKEFKDELKKYKYLEKFGIDIEVLENETNILNSLKTKLTKLTKLYNDIQTLENSKNKILPLLNLSPIYKKLETKIEKKKQIAILLKNINEKVTEFSNLKNDAKLSVSLKELEPLYIKVCKRIDNAEKQRKTVNKLIYSIKQYNEFLKNEKNTQNQLDKNRQEWENKFPDICPLCGK